jgi:hypothetical protein
MASLAPSASPAGGASTPQHDARADAEAAKTAQAIAAFESLAQRLEAIAEARRPLWHRLLWRG